MEFTQASNQNGRTYDLNQILSLYNTNSTKQAASRIRKTMPQDIDFGVGRSIPSLPHTGRPLRPFFSDHQDHDVEIEPALQTTIPSFLGTRRTPLGSISMSNSNMNHSISSSGAFQGVLSGIMSTNDSPAASGLPSSGLPSRRRINGDTTSSVAGEGQSLRNIKTPNTSMSMSNGPVSPTRDLSTTSRSDGASTWRRSITQSTPLAGAPPMMGREKDSFASEKPIPSGLPDGFGSGGGLLFTSPTKARRLVSSTSSPQARQTKERDSDSLAALQPQTQTVLRSPLVLKQDEVVDNPLPSEYESQRIAKAAVASAKHSEGDPTALLKGVLGIGANSSLLQNNVSETAPKPSSLFDNVGEFDDLLGPRKPISVLEKDALISDVRYASHQSDPFLSRHINAAETTPSTTAISTPPGLPPPGFNPSELLWTYKDPTGTIQGPFSGKQMQEWYKAQFFSSDLLVKREKWNDDYRRLDILVSALGADAPFLHHAVVKKDLSVTAPERKSPWQTSSEQRPFPPTSQPSLDPFHPVHHHPTASLSQSARQFTTNFDPFAPSRSQDSNRPDSTVIPASHSYPQSLAAAASPTPWNRTGPFAPVFDDQLVSHSASPAVFPVYSTIGPSPPHHRTPTGNHSSLSLSSPGHSEHSSLAPLPAVRTPINAWQQNVIDARSLSSESRHQPNLLADLLSSPPLSAQLEGISTMPNTEPLHLEVLKDFPPDIISTAMQLKADSDVRLPQELEVGSKRSKDAEDAKVLEPVSKSATAKKSALAQPQAPIPPTVESPAKPAKAKKLSSGSSEKPTTVEALSAQAPLQSVVEPDEVKGKPATAPWSAKETVETSAGSGPSLREIQAKEAKAEELRKAATKKVKAAALAAEQVRLSALEDASVSLPTASSWAQSSGAPWANASSAKKTLKEIQEEEARQQEKRLVAQRTTGAPLASKGYAGSVAPSRVVSPAANSAGSWSVIGSGGKVALSEAAAPVVRTASAHSAKVAPSPAIVHLSAANGKKKAAVNSAALAIAESPSPSADLLKWMRSALIGLTVPMDDFINMLLQFPVNADPATMEIISDAVYANSRTLDGRRFAESFVMKRKADLAIGPSMATTAAAASLAPKTAADILKTQPKKQEALNFKIVSANKQSKTKKK